jgi:hypothetical protein
VVWVTRFFSTFLAYPKLLTQTLHSMWDPPVTGTFFSSFFPFSRPMLYAGHRRPADRTSAFLLVRCAPRQRSPPSTIDRAPRARPWSGRTKSSRRRSSTSTTLAELCRADQIEAAVGAGGHGGRRQGQRSRMGAGDGGISWRRRARG